MKQRLFRRIAQLMVKHCKKLVVSILCEVGDIYYGSDNVYTALDQVTYPEMCRWYQEYYEDV